MKRLARILGSAALLLGFAAMAMYALSVGFTVRQLQAADCRIAALMYHAVVPDEVSAARYWIPESAFAAQMDDLAATGARTPELDDVAAALHPDDEVEDESCPFGPRDVLITFDMDGLHQQENLALPHLERNGFTGIFFVPTASIDRGRYVTSAALGELAAAGMTIGSHTERHRDMRTEPSDSMIASLIRTRDTLNVLTGQTITSVAAPGGRYDSRVMRDVERAGFITFFNSDPCYISPSTSPHQLCRIEIRGDGGLSPSQALDTPVRVAVQAMNWRTKRAVERLVGARAFALLGRWRSGLEGDGY